jgi:hypothetical protein
MDSIEDIVKRLPPEALTAATLERVFRAVATDCYAIISAFRSGVSTGWNVAADRKLRYALKSMGFGSLTMKAVYENDVYKTSGF